jgi:octaprenyl-diphosphate synthase
VKAQWPDRGADDDRRADLHGFAFANHENLVKGDFCANCCRYLFYFQFFAADNPILLAPGFYDRVHVGLQITRRSEAKNRALYVFFLSRQRVCDAPENPFLLHDDVVDASDLRRGRQTANAMFGNSASVLVGDFLYSRAFQMMVAVNDMRIMRVLSDATNVIAEGEVLQLMNCHDADLDETGYLQVIRYKTAKLFEAAAQVGAIIGGASMAIEQAMAIYGAHLGTAFQLIDDVLDYSGAEVETGKHLGDDLAEGKPTLPLIFVLKNGNADQVASVRRAIENGGRDDLPEVLAAIRGTGALEYAKRKAATEAQHAAVALELVPASQYKDSLLELCLFAVARTH